MKRLLLDIETRGLRDALYENVVVADSGCHEWTGTLRRGYGAMRWDNGYHSAHRLSLALHKGPPPDEKPWALHHCDNRACINPEHLYWGSPGDNTRDMISRGRASGGRAGATHCVNGHEFTEDNTYWEPRGWGRACKACRRQRVREYRARQAVSA